MTKTRATRGEQRLVEAVGLEVVQALCALVLLAHRDPRVGDDHVRRAHRLPWVVENS
jgi:hypothetical protein